MNELYFSPSPIPLIFIDADSKLIWSPGCSISGSIIVLHVDLFSLTFGSTVIFEGTVSSSNSTKLTAVSLFDSISRVSIYKLNK